MARAGMPSAAAFIQLGNVRSPVEERELCMYVQVAEFRHKASQYGIVKLRNASLRATAVYK